MSDMNAPFFGTPYGEFDESILGGRGIVAHQFTPEASAKFLTRLWDTGEMRRHSWSSDLISGGLNGLSISEQIGVLDTYVNTAMQSGLVPLLGPVTNMTVSLGAFASLDLRLPSFSHNNIGHLQTHAMTSYIEGRNLLQHFSLGLDFDSILETGTLDLLTDINGAKYPGTDKRIADLMFGIQVGPDIYRLGGAHALLASRVPQTGFLEGTPYGQAQAYTEHLGHQWIKHYVASEKAQAITISPDLGWAAFKFGIKFAAKALTYQAGVAVEKFRDRMFFLMEAGVSPSTKEAIGADMAKFMHTTMHMGVATSETALDVAGDLSKILEDMPGDVRDGVVPVAEGAASFAYAAGVVIVDLGSRMESAAEPLMTGYVEIFEQVTGVSPSSKIDTSSETTGESETISSALEDFGFGPGNINLHYDGDLLEFRDESGNSAYLDPSTHDWVTAFPAHQEDKHDPSPSSSSVAPTSDHVDAENKKQDEDAAAMKRLDDAIEAENNRLDQVKAAREELAEIEAANKRRDAAEALEVTIEGQAEYQAEKEKREAEVKAAREKIDRIEADAKKKREEYEAEKEKAEKEKAQESESGSHHGNGSVSSGRGVIWSDDGSSSPTSSIAYPVNPEDMPLDPNDPLTQMTIRMVVWLPAEFRRAFLESILGKPTIGNPSPVANPGGPFSYDTSIAIAHAYGSSLTMPPLGSSIPPLPETSGTFGSSVFMFPQPRS